MEQKIFTALAYQGWTDDEIITFATHYRLPRHVQEWARHKDYSWTNRSLRKVREHIAVHPPLLALLLVRVYVWEVTVNVVTPILIAIKLFGS